jgi:hypothetical protein
MGSIGKIFNDMLLPAGYTGYTGACGTCMQLRYETSRIFAWRTDMEPMENAISTDTITACPREGGVMPLEKELGVYKANLIDLLASAGKYVLIFGEQIGGIFEGYEDALQAGYDKYGLEPFLVKQISRAEPIYYFSRDLSACRF